MLRAVLQQVISLSAAGLLVCLVSGPALAEPSPPLICVDAGHGGRQDGAIGPDKQKEKDLALQVAKRLATELREQLGARVLMTREKDVEVDLEDRVRLANEARADVFISVHANSMPVGRARNVVSGMETYFLSTEASGEIARGVVARENAEQRKKQAPADALSFILDDLARTSAHHDASRLAYTVHTRMAGEVGANDRGVHQAPFVVLMGAQMPAILVEIGYISNPREAKKLAEPAYQKEIAAAVARGVGEFLTLIGRRAESPARTGSATAEPLVDGSHPAD